MEIFRALSFFSYQVRIIQELMEVGKAAGCYKVILDCSEKNVGFYEKCGFQRKEVLMAWYIPEKH